jgi:hypothetical protein
LFRSVPLIVAQLGMELRKQDVEFRSQGHAAADNHHSRGAASASFATPSPVRLDAN